MKKEEKRNESDEQRGTKCRVMSRERDEMQRGAERYELREGRNTERDEMQGVSQGKNDRDSVTEREEVRQGEG